MDITAYRTRQLIAEFSRGKSCAWVELGIMQGDHGGGGNSFSRITLFADTESEHDLLRQYSEAINAVNERFAAAEAAEASAEETEPSDAA